MIVIRHAESTIVLSLIFKMFYMFAVITKLGCFDENLVTTIINVFRFGTVAGTNDVLTNI